MAARHKGYFYSYGFSFFTGTVMPSFGGVLNVSRNARMSASSCSFSSTPSGGMPAKGGVFIEQCALMRCFVESAKSFERPERVDCAGSWVTVLTFDTNRCLT